jgi:hypothetical protein
MTLDKNQVTTHKLMVFEDGKSTQENPKTS